MKRMYITPASVAKKALMKISNKRRTKKCNTNLSGMFIMQVKVKLGNEVTKLIQSNLS